MPILSTMCGRFTLTATPEAVAQTFGLEALDPFPPRYNIAPTQPILIVTREARRGAPKRVGRLARWGLIPAWVKDPSRIPLLFNARSETAAERQSFRAAMRYRRCLVPASGFYEWRRAGPARPEPFFARPTGDAPVAFAALCETSLASDGSEIDTAAILTAPAEAGLREIHERAPVVIAPAGFARWLDTDDHAPASVADLLHARSTDTFQPFRVSDRVNAVANMGPEVQEPYCEPTPLPSQMRLL